MTPHNHDHDRRLDPPSWPIDRDALQREGSRRRDAGMTAAADFKAVRVRAGQVALLDALLTSGDGTATIDDATPRSDLRQAFGDGGQWRGSVTRGLAEKGLIEKVAAGPSLRPSRHAGTRYVWRLVSRPNAIIARCRLAAAVELSLTTAAELAADQQKETPPASLCEERADGVSDGSNPNQEDSNRG